MAKYFDSVDNGNVKLLIYNPGQKMVSIRW